MTRGFLDPVTSLGPLQSYLADLGCGEMTRQDVFLLRPSDTFGLTPGTGQIEFNVKARFALCHQNADKNVPSFSVLRRVERATRSVATVRVKNPFYSQGQTLHLIPAFWLLEPCFEERETRYGALWRSRCSGRCTRRSRPSFLPDITATTTRLKRDRLMFVDEHPGFFLPPSSSISFRTAIVRQRLRPRFPALWYVYLFALLSTNPLTTLSEDFWLGVVDRDVEDIIPPLLLGYGLRATLRRTGLRGPSLHDLWNITDVAGVAWDVVFATRPYPIWLRAGGINQMSTLHTTPDYRYSFGYSRPVLAGPRFVLAVAPGSCRSCFAPVYHLVCRGLGWGHYCLMDWVRVGRPRSFDLVSRNLLVIVVEDIGFKIVSTQFRLEGADASLCKRSRLGGVGYSRRCGSRRGREREREIGCLEGEFRLWNLFGFFYRGTDFIYSNRSARSVVHIVDRCEAISVRILESSTRRRLLDVSSSRNTRTTEEYDWLKIDASSTNLQLQCGSGADLKRQRRMTSPSATSLTLPEKTSPSGRPPSPLRNEFMPNTFTGIDMDAESEACEDDEEDEDNRWMRSPSPSSSMSQIAATFAQRMGTWMSPAKSPNALPTDAELEAEAERERERSRREAERILTEEAAGRRLVEDRVLAMLESTRSLPPPPSRSQTMPNPPSPASSQTGLWSVVKNKLTPTKELTPAQQVIQETKARDKKGSKGKEKAWPANTANKFSDPAFLNLNSTLPTTPPRRPVSSPNVSPTPSRPSPTIPPPNLSPSPMRTGEPSSVSSPSREAPPLYAQFDANGTLDVHVTLLTIAKRFEKLEKWTVGHVRALEERMSDVERWLVDKEKEKEDEQVSEKETHDSAKEIQEIREELSEMQSRVGELGREMAKIATAPANLSSGPTRQSAEIIAPQLTSSTMVTPHHNRYQSQQATISPPLGSAKTSASRLPYPTGDYASPPDSTIASFSPPVSPPHSRPVSISGLPNPAPSTSSTSSASSVTSATSGLPPPSISSSRRTSISPTPTPRKRYTVALGGPIVAPEEQQSIGRAFFSESPGAVSDDEKDEDDDDDFGEETIGKKSSARMLSETSPPPSLNDRRTRTQSTPTAPLTPRVRSKSSERSLSLSSNASGAAGTFVDPYKVRQQTMSANKVAMPKPIGKVPIGQLVAFFDGDKK
ncbi:hypothetical protein BDZ89DRAFT_1045252 [Hymenopellis radicata]|nr:hypothetical protein BDZ89DRAFT_1045252 [Hymenopellis radicata]